MKHFSLKKTLPCAAVLLAAALAATFSACDDEKLPENLILIAPDAVYAAPDALGVYLADGNMLQVKRGDEEVMKVQLGLKSDRANYDIASMTLKGGIPKKAKLAACKQHHRWSRQARRLRPGSVDDGRLRDHHHQQCPQDDHRFRHKTHEFRHTDNLTEEDNQ